MSSIAQDVKNFTRILNIISNDEDTGPDFIRKTIDARIFRVNPEVIKAAIFESLQPAIKDLGLKALREVNLKEESSLKSWGRQHMSAPWPDIKLPFPEVFFSYGRGAELNPMLLRTMGLPYNENAPAFLIGHMVTQDGYLAYGVEYHNHADYPIPRPIPTVNGRIEYVNPQGSFIMGSILFSPSKGSSGQIQLVNIWLPLLTSWVNEARTIVEVPTLGAKIQWKKNLKKLPIKKKRPPEFYTVEVSPKVISGDRSKAPPIPKDIDWNHRWDVRGHERVRVYRGPKPIDPKKRLSLLDRGYTLYEYALDDKGHRIMNTRGFRQKGIDEWVAMKSVWVKPHTKGPSDKPYIQSIHKVNI